MKRTIPSLLCFLVVAVTSQRASCQQYDRHWLGLDYSNSNSVSFMRFDTDGIHYLLSGVTSKMQIDDGCFAMSNAEGELQFYTNGNAIASWDHSIMEGGKGFNQGASADDFGTFWGDTVMNLMYEIYTYQVIPDAYDGHIYYMIHSFDTLSDDCKIYDTPKMQISKIDMSANGGKGKVVYKNHYFDQELVGPYFAIVRHGNGKDWWVVLKKQDGLVYRSILLQKDSVVRVVTSTMPGLSSDWFTCDDWISTNFNLLLTSPDGNRLVDNYGAGKVKLMAFDRCSGEVSLLDTFSTGITPLEVAGTVYNCPVFTYEFSPSGRYLYGAGYAEFAQWNLTAADIAGSKVKLGGAPWALDDEQNVLTGLSTGGFSVFSPGPDGKIYNLFRTAHSVIEHPDEPGEACGLCLAADSPPSCLDVPYWLYSNRYPNYRLGALPGSPCDTILSDTHVVKESMQALHVVPNPADDAARFFLLNHPANEIQVEIFTAAGQQVYTGLLSLEGELVVPVTGWQNGLYIAKVTGETEHYTRSFVVQHP